MKSWPPSPGSHCEPLGPGKDQGRQDQDGDQDDKREIGKHVDGRQGRRQPPAQGQGADGAAQDAGVFPQAGQVQRQKQEAERGGTLHQVQRGEPFRAAEESFGVEWFQWHIQGGRWVVQYRDAAADNDDDDEGSSLPCHKGPSVAAYRRAVSPTWLLAQYFSRPCWHEGKPAKLRVVARDARKASSPKALAPMNAMPLEPALRLNPGTMGPESTSGEPGQEAGHS